MAYPTKKVNIVVDDLKREGGDPNRVSTRKKIQRRPGKTRNARLYFHSGTQDAIVLYQGEPDKKEREKIYVQEIKPAFEKLVENLINIHKFTIYHDSTLDMVNDCTNFLFETIHKFDAKRGTNAFSYFNVVAKNWLIIKSKQRQMQSRRSVSLFDPDVLSNNDLITINDYCTLPAQDEIVEKQKTCEDILEVLYEIRNMIKTENELSCINSIIVIFENIDDIDIINKSAILLYMRELSGLAPKQLTMTMQSVRRYYKEIKCTMKSTLFDWEMDDELRDEEDECEEDDLEVCI